MAKRIIHFDLDPVVREQVKKCLEEKGYAVVSCGTAKEYNVVLREQAPDMIIVEVGDVVDDAGKTGWDLLQERKETPTLRGIPAMVLTREAQDTDVFRGWQIGVDVYLTKPFNPRELLPLIRNIFTCLEDESG